MQNQMIVVRKGKSYKLPIMDYNDQIGMTSFFEGFHSKVYTDTKGNPTIGYGFNLKDKMVKDLVGNKKSLTVEEAQPILKALVNRAQRDAKSYLGADTFSAMTSARKAIITDMAYNLGLDKLNKFKKMRKYILMGDWSKAAVEMEDSKWADQVGQRSAHHITIFRRGY